MNRLRFKTRWQTPIRRTVQKISTPTRDFQPI